MYTNEEMLASIKKVEANSAGFVSYILLGAVTFIVSLALLFLLVK